jgi:hypothetical protein
MKACHDKFARRNRPTPEQQAAYRRLIARGGWQNVTLDDARHLATMRYLTESQRAQFAAMAQAESTVR